MGVAYKKGQILSENDLKIIIRDPSGTPTDPYYITYSLFDNTTGMQVLIGDQDRIPATTGVGQYYVPSTIPLDANIGDWLVRWNFRESPTSPLIEVVQEFNIVGEDMVVSITGNEIEDGLIRRLRIMLRDNNPDRNYRFRPPSTEKYLQSQTQVFGYIWEDEELYEYILMGIDEFNLAPPVTGITINTMPSRWTTLVIMRAAGFACAALTMNWIADEFSVGGEELIEIRTEDGEVSKLTIEELYGIIYGEEHRAFEEAILEEIKKAKDEFPLEVDCDD